MLTIRSASQTDAEARPISVADAIEAMRSAIRPIMATDAAAEFAATNMVADVPTVGSIGYAGLVIRATR